MQDRTPRGARAFHPLLFGAFPVLFLFRENLWGLSPSDIATPLLLTLGAIAIAQLLAGRLTKRPRKIALVVSALALLFFSYGHVWRVLTRNGEHELLGVDPDIVLGAAWIALLVLLVVLTTRTKRSLVDLTRVLNVIALAMVAFVAVPLGAELLQNRATASTKEATDATSAKVELPKHRPDIYYLVFDRYAGARTLEELFGYDNQDLIEYLHTKGFQVADRARANYQATAPSLASSLNMNYLNWLAKRLDGRSAHSAAPMYGAIKDNQVQRFLHARGYRSVTVGSRWDMTRDNPFSDVNIRTDPMTEFTRVFFGTTALLPAMRHGVLSLGETDRPELARDVSLRQFDELAKLPQMPGPKFVFAHFGLPHPPYVFDADGSAVDKQPLGVAPKARAYIKQLQYTNTRIKRLIDEITDVPKDKQPVIVLPADEGPYPSFGYEAPEQWWKTTDAKLRTKFRILMAMRIPGAEGAAYSTMTPVNTFRVVFNSVFRTDLPLFPDESFVPTTHGEYWKWVRITGRLEDPPGPVRAPAYGPYVDALPHVRRSG